MDIINPITITDSILTGSNVPENDATEYDPTSAYAQGNTVMVATSTANMHKTYECLTAQTAGITADILNDDCSDLSSWTDNDTGTGVSEVSPAGQFRFDTNAGIASRYRTIASPPDTFTLEIEAYFDSIGTYANVDDFRFYYTNGSWMLYVSCASDGLYIRKAGWTYGEVGTNILKSGSTAAWQKLRFQVDKTTESSATVEVFLDDESQGTVDCDYEPGSGTDGMIAFIQYGQTTDNMVTHLNSIKIATGLGPIVSVGDTPVGNVNWLEVDSTNRWKAFNGVLGSQTEQATKIEYILTPGEAIDSVALLNLESDTVDIVEIDSADNLIINGEAWTGASGTTQPTGWDKVGTPTDFTVYFGSYLKITTDAAGEGISQTINVTPETEYQFITKYINGTGDIAQIAIYDVTHSADIVAVTDLADATVWGLSYSNVFVTPAGCTSIKVSLLVKSSGDSVYFASAKLAPTEYSETVTTGATKTDVVKMDIPQIATGILTVTINKSGTAKIGELIIGQKISLGTTLASPPPKVSIEDYSSQSQDTFGHWTIVRRGYAKKMSLRTKIEATDLLTVRQNSDYIFGVLSACRSLMRVWIGDDNLSCMIVYGKYNTFELELSCNNYSLLDHDILGMI